MCKKLKCIFTVQVSLGLCLLLLGIDVIRCHLLTRQRTRWNIIGIDWWILNQRILYKFFQRAQIIVTRSARTIIAIVVNIIKRILLYISTVSLFVICLQQWRRVRKHGEIVNECFRHQICSARFHIGVALNRRLSLVNAAIDEVNGLPEHRPGAALLFYFIFLLRELSNTIVADAPVVTTEIDDFYLLRRRLIKLLFRARHAKLSSPCP